VDILVEFDPDQKTFDNFMQLAFFLEDLFDRKVDLITTESLSPYLGPHILREVEYAAIRAHPAIQAMTALPNNSLNRSPRAQARRFLRNSFPIYKCFSRKSGG
jgi:hypothetical protein